jgi:aspartyl-tRNA(Asn)/glutamyl-tRNA(Gln) amidotransferase subunit C
MAITRDDVLHVAELAQLELTEEEIERLGSQLSAILEAVGKVSQLDLADVPPTSHPLDLVNVWAEDEPRPSLAREDALRNAPEREGGFFRVPPTS